MVQGVVPGGGCGTVGERIGEERGVSWETGIGGCCALAGLQGGACMVHGRKRRVRRGGVRWRGQRGGVLGKRGRFGWLRRSHVEECCPSGQGVSWTTGSCGIGAR